VNRTGTDYACIQGWGFGDGPTDATMVAGLKTWPGLNSVRVLMNEDCWLGINGAAAAFSGANYQQFIRNYVNLLNANGFYVIVEMQWAAPGTQQSTGIIPMPDLDHAPAFWTGVANAFKGNNAVIFELYNEPHDVSWSCWRNGGSSCSTGYAVAGFQTLVDTVRATGATNVITQGGLEWSNDLSGWLANRPNDPLNNMAASWHVYNFNSCNNTACWDSRVAPVAAAVPIIATEVGTNPYDGSALTSVMSWLDAHGGSYQMWAWNTWGGPESLISNFNGTPSSPYGVLVRDHFAAY
jgi:hypothetical protein